MNILGTISLKIEKVLYKRGFRILEVRQLVSYQLMLTAAAVIAALAVGWAEPGIVHFAAGAVLVTVNFYSLAKFSQRMVKRQSGAIVRQLASFYFRLLLTLIALYVLIIELKVSVSALLAGLTTVVATILIWGAIHLLGRHTKEA